MNNPQLSFDKSSFDFDPNFEEIDQSPFRMEKSSCLNMYADFSSLDRSN